MSMYDCTVNGSVAYSPSLKLVPNTSEPLATKSKDAGSYTIGADDGQASGSRAPEFLCRALTWLRLQGMTDATMREFNRAIKVSDELYTDGSALAQLLINLEKGRKSDGSQLSAKERLQTHKLINQEFENAGAGLHCRLIYVEHLRENNQFEQAKLVGNDCIIVASKLPVDALKAELEQLCIDLHNPDLHLNAFDENDLHRMVESILIIEFRRLGCK